MSDFVFISPTVQFREKDLTFPITNIGLTTLGMVGETQKGAAFEPVLVTSKTDFRTRFGSRSPEKLGGKLKYTLPYYADSYLSESNQLYVTRVLGLSGYDAGKAWVITASDDNEYNNIVIGVLRSKADYSGNVNINFRATEINIENISSDNDILSDFKIIVIVNSEPVEYIVSLNESSPNFISKVFGDMSKQKSTPIYVESVYPQLIKKLANDVNFINGLNIFEIDDISVSDYKSPYQTPETPWIVSQLRGNSLERLFKLISISDGDSANKEIKISIANVNFNTQEFDLFIRDFNDTDDNQIILESFTRCTMNESINSFIGRRIGTTDEKYPLRSKYVMVEMSDSFSEDSLPCGFEGYKVRDYNSLGDFTNTKMIYKKSYSTTDKIRKTFLGISEKAFDGLAYKGNGINQNMFNYIGSVTNNLNKTKGFHLDSDIESLSDITDGDYILGDFEGGLASYKSQSDQNDISNPYNNIQTVKFTLVPAGGFDGWDIHRNMRTNTELFRPNSTFDFPESDYYAYRNAIFSFDNPEQVLINIFATPGINFFDNLSLVNETIEMIEEERKDSIYVVDAPDIASTAGYAEEISDLLSDTGIDSSYTATYSPYIEVFDRDNNINVFIPPTGEVVRAMAFVDNKKFPWFSPAGLENGTVNARRTKRILKKPERDTLYRNRINPLVFFPNTGVSIMGQKTLQFKDSALDRINVRRLLLELRRQVANIAVRLLFNQNDQTVIDEFISKVTPILENTRRERGLNFYSIRPNSELNTPEAIDRNELYFIIELQPTPALEFIGVDFYITPTGAFFSNI